MHIPKAVAHKTLPPMALGPPPSLKTQLLRSITPTPASLAICAGLATVITILHFIVISVHQGGLLPNFLDGQWQAAYDAIVAKPVDAFLAKATLNNILVIVMWGFLGLMVYTGVEHMLRNYHDYHEAEDEIVLLDSQHVVRRPLIQTFLLALVWRAIIGGLYFVWFIVCMVVLGAMGVYAALPFGQASRFGVMEHFIGVAIVWALLFHIFVVLARFASRRTRLAKRPTNIVQEGGFFRY